MAEIRGLPELNKKLRELGKKAKKEDLQDVIVGYTQSYALFVHERTWANYRNNRQAKYLETPAREFAGALYRIVVSVYSQTGSLQKALLVAGLRLQRESQKIVPIDTGALRASAYTRKEKAR